jgi:hypothetical protein
LEIVVFEIRLQLTCRSGCRALKSGALAIAAAATPPSPSSGAFKSGSRNRHLLRGLPELLDLALGGGVRIARIERACRRGFDPALGFGAARSLAARNVSWLPCPVVGFGPLAGGLGLEDTRAVSLPLWRTGASALGFKLAFVFD